MNLYVVSTPFHLMFTMLNKRSEDKIIVINSFNLRKGTFTDNLLQENFPEQNVLVLKPTKHFKKRLYILPFYVWKIKNLIKSKMNECFEEIYIFNDVDPICQVV